MKYKNLIIGIGILFLGILIGNIFSGSENSSQVENEHLYSVEKENQIWTCSMHPQIKLEKEGQCPICAMDLIPLVENNSTEKIEQNEIVMTPEAIQLANIQTIEIKKSNVNKEIRLLGTVKADERRISSQVSHISGRIEQLYINFTGEKVRKGQRIAKIYSPELISAQKELFEAIKSKDIYPQLFIASKNKLKSWKLSESQIEAIIKSRKVKEKIDILSDYSGFVMSKYVALGDYLNVGSKLFEIANIDKVWILFDVYEADIPWIKKGDEITFYIQAVQGENLKGRITHIDPFVSSESRVAKVRVELNNKSHKLLPEMYANGTVKAKLSNEENAIIIPKSAVLWTGKRSIVYVRVPHKNTISFAYREIILGDNLGEFYLVRNGLLVGESIAVNGVFRIDASAQLMGKQSMMNQVANSKSKKTSVKIDSVFQKNMGFVIENYTFLKNALVESDALKSQSLVKNIKKSVNTLDIKSLNRDIYDVWLKALKPINKALETIQNSTDIEVQREVFIALSYEMINIIENLGIETFNNKPLYLEFCPMADNNTGAYWLSYDKEIRNPYFGDKMLKCGEVKTEY